MLKVGQYTVHAGLCVAYLSVGLSQIEFVIPFMLLQLAYVIQGNRKKAIFEQTRQWQFFNGQAQLLLEPGSQSWQKVDVQAHQVWPFMVILKFRPSAKTEQPRNRALFSWQWDIIMSDACQAEHFRQLRALMRTDYLRG